MIKPTDLEQLHTNPDVTDKVYNELMLHGIDSFRTSNKETQPRIFSKICHDIIQQYIVWNDYVHSNNIMQLFKDTILSSDKAPKPSWFIRYEITIYGKRTPLFFIDKPQAFFSRIDTVFARGKEAQNKKIVGAALSLLQYYSKNFLSQNTDEEEKKIFVEHLRCSFLKEYEKIDKSSFPVEIVECINQINDYVKTPSLYVEPGVKYSDLKLWDEDDEELCDVVSEQTSTQTPALTNENILPANTQEQNSEFAYLQGKTITFIGSIKNSLVVYINWLSKKYGFVANVIADYDKLTNLDLRKFRYSDKVSAIIAGPMPHSIKGTNGYSSGLEMLRSEPGYPPVFECIASEKLKITRTSINKALQEVNCALMSL